MRQINSLNIALCALLALAGASAPITASSTWNSITTNISDTSDLNTNTNWNPQTVPTSDVAIFNSKISHINTTPSATSFFQVNSFNFVNSAKAFTFSFDNCELEFDDAGITGGKTDTTINVTNTDNTDSVSEQVYFYTNSSLGHAILNIINTGTYSGSDPSVTLSALGEAQLYVNAPFTILSGGKVTASNTGVDASTGTGGNDIADVSYYFMYFSDTLTVGDDVTISYSNDGTNSSTGSDTYVSYCSEYPFVVSGAFEAGDNLTLTTANTAVDSSTGTGNNKTCYIQSSQMEFEDTISIGNNAFIKVSNKGTFSGSNDTNSNEVAHPVGYQFTSDSTFQAGNSLHMQAENIGNDSSTGVGGNNVGFLNYSQLRFDDTVVVGDYATIEATNSGTWTGSNTMSGSDIGYIQDRQFTVGGTFQAGNSFNMSVSNEGTDQGTGHGSCNVGYVSGPQVEFFGGGLFGTDAKFVISNSGTSGDDANGSTAGYVGQEQLVFSGPFQAGKNLSIDVTNIGTTTTNADQTGYVVGSQISFNSSCTLDDGAVLTVANKGTGNVGGSQINFGQGFDINSGKVTFHASNEGTVANYGIYVGDGLGGNANIILENTSLHVDTALSTFTIGELNGDSGSSVQVKPQLVISTDASANGNFAGDIQDFPSLVSTLVKTGPGTQKLSGPNSFTGLTTVEEGTLILTGSLQGALNVDTSGTLKGTGSVHGDVISVGKIAPGESIGTIHFLSDFTNNNGEYDVEVNGAGQSDLISVGGDVLLNGGLILVSTVDGTYRFQDRYTIVESVGSVTGTYTGAIAASTLIQPVVTYDPQHVYLTLLAATARAARTSNQLAIGTQLDSIVNPNALQSLMISQIANLPIDEARDALDSLSGYQHTEDYITTQIINRQFIRRLFDPLRSIVTTEPNCCCYPCYDDFGVWLDVGGSFTSVSGNSNARGFSTNGYDITGGIQKTFCCDWTFGAGGAYEQDHLHFNKSGGWEHSNTWLVGLYGLYRPSYFYGLVDFAYGNSSNKLKRSIHAGSLHYHADSKPSTSQYTFYGEVGMDYSLCNVLLQPFFGLELGSFQRKHVSENQPEGWGLVVKKRNQFLTTTRLGVHVTTEGLLPDNIDLSLDVAWNLRLTSAKNKVHERFEDFGTPFEIKGIKLNSNSIDYALTLSMPFCANFSGYIEGFGESWSNANTFNVLAGVKFCW